MRHRFPHLADGSRAFARAEGGSMKAARCSSAAIVIGARWNTGRSNATRKRRDCRVPAIIASQRRRARFELQSNQVAASLSIWRAIASISRCSGDLPRHGRTKCSMTHGAWSFALNARRSESGPPDASSREVQPTAVHRRRQRGLGSCIPLVGNVHASSLSDSK